MNGASIDRLPAWLVLLPIPILLIAFFLPLVVVSGPIHEDIRVSGWDVVARLGGGDDGTKTQDDGIAGKAMGDLKRELQGLEVPLAGPVIIALSLLCLLAHVALAVTAAIRHPLGRRTRRWHLAAMSAGVLFGIIFPIGTAVLQRGLNEVAGSGLAQRLVALVSKAAASLYRIDMGAGGWLVAVGAVVGLVLALVAARRSPSALTPGPSA